MCKSPEKSWNRVNEEDKVNERIRGLIAVRTLDFISSEMRSHGAGLRKEVTSYDVFLKDTENKLSGDILAYSMKVKYQ